MNDSLSNAAVYRQNKNTIGVIVLLITLAILPCIYLVSIIIPKYQNKQLNELGGLLSAQLAEQSTDLVVHNDTLGLNVITRQLANHQSVAYVAVYDDHQQRLAEAGAFPESSDTGFEKFKSNVIAQDKLIGEVELILRNDMIASSQNYTLKQWLWILSAWSILLIITGVAYVRLSIQNKPAAPENTQASINALQKILHILNINNPVEGTAEHGNITENLLTWHTTHSAILVIEICNLSMLLQRLNNKTMARLIDECYGNIDTSAKLYNGQLSGWIGKNMVVCFNGNNQTTECFFHAICCSELIMGLTHDLNEQLAANNLPRVKMRMALHVGDVLAKSTVVAEQVSHHMVSEIITVATEICQNAESNQLLMSDDIYTAETIAQRIIVSEPHVVVLECINRPLTTYTLLDLQPTYRELLTRQIQHLIQIKNDPAG